MESKIRHLTSEYDLYLQDESRKKGYGDSISFPENADEVSEIVRYCAQNDMVLTVRSGGTGVGSGAVAFGGHIMSMEKMNSIELSSDGMSVTAGAGCSLNELNRFVNAGTGGKMFLPPDPTEGSAEVGGMVSCNSSGARTYMYGPMRNYIKRLKIVLSDGSMLDIERGKAFASGRRFKIEENSGDSVAVTGAELHPPKNLKEKSVKRVLRGNLPGYTLPKVKNAAGYYVYEDMDLIDLFIGSEGTLGIITEAEFALERKPEYIWGVIAFFKEENGGIDLAEKIKQSGKIRNNIMSIEFFDKGSLMLLRKKAEITKEFRPIPDDFREAVFTELKGDSRQEMIDTLKVIEALTLESGGNSDDAWCAVSLRSFKDFKELRHATPECVNNKIADIKKIHPSITKLGSDMAVPDDRFRETVEMYKRDLMKSGLDYVMFGHIGNSHLHVNIISRNEREYMKGKEIFSEWAEKIGAMGGSVSAEHGIGKLKREFLIKMYGEKSVDEMRNLKKAFDSKGILNRDNIFLWNVD